ncbi:MAG: hypothetical protein U9R74_13490, partial [Pseudomonadota bacterium]|nr:hypothetical protein [Pseudomonadota bacterium]
GGGGVTTPRFFMPYRASIDLVQSDDFGVDVQLTGQATRGEMMIHQGKYDAATQQVDDLLPDTVVYVENGRIMKKGLSSLEDPPQQVSSAIDVTQCPEIGNSVVNTLVTDFDDADTALYLYEVPGPDGQCLANDDNQTRMVRLSDAATSGPPRVVPSLFPEATFLDLGTGTLTGVLAVNEDLLLPVPVRQLNLYDADYANPVLVRNFLSDVRSLTGTATAAFLDIDGNQLVRVNPDASQVLVYPVPDGARLEQAVTDGTTLFFLQSNIDGLTLFSLPMAVTNVSPPTVPRTLFNEPLADVSLVDTEMFLTTNRVVLDLFIPGVESLISLDKVTANQTTLEVVSTDNGEAIDRVGTTGAFVFYNVFDGTDVSAVFLGEGGAKLDRFPRSAWAGFTTPGSAVPVGLPVPGLSHLVLALGYDGTFDIDGLSGADVTTYRIADRATEIVGTLDESETNLSIASIGPVGLGSIEVASSGPGDASTVFALDVVLSRFSRITDSLDGDASPVPSPLTARIPQEAFAD